MVENEQDDLDLLRLRVLATRKRLKSAQDEILDREDREDGELSEPEVQLSLRVSKGRKKLPPPYSFPVSDTSLNYLDREAFHFESYPFESMNFIPLSNYEGTEPLRAKRLRAREDSSESADPAVKTAADKDSTSAAGRFFGKLELELAASKSPTFSPQSCSIILDMDSEDDGYAGLASLKIHRGISKDSFESARRLQSSPIVTTLALGLVQRELEKQKKLLLDTSLQLQKLEKEKLVLDSRFNENEALITSAVEKQQKLKTQIKATKEVILRGKELRSDFTRRQAILSREFAQKSNLYSVLEASVRAKSLAQVPAAGTLERTKMQTETEGEKQKGEQRKEANTDAKVQMENGEKKTPLKTSLINRISTNAARTAGIVELEKKTLKLRQEMMAAQIALMQKRALHKKNAQLHAAIANKKPKKPSNLASLSKLLALTPPMLATPKDDPLSEGVDPIPSVDIYIKSASPSFLYNIGGYTFSADLLVCIFECIGQLSKTHAQSLDTMDLSLEEPSLPVTDEASLASFDEHRFVQVRVVEERLSTTYSVYESPLRAFRTYRFSPFFLYSAPAQGLLSRTFTNRIRHEAIVCPFDLSSRCWKNNCTLQHFRSIFMDDSSILEDYMLTLLKMPTRHPFRDRQHLLEFVKKKMFGASMREQPLVALVWIIIDAYKLMEKRESIISFEETPAARNAELESAVKGILNSSKAAVGSAGIDNLRLDRARSYLVGVEDMYNGALPRLWRYFDVQNGLNECQVFLESNPHDIEHWVELFLMHVAKAGGPRNRSNVVQALPVLEQGLEKNPSSKVLWALYCDVVPLAAKQSQTPSELLSTQETSCKSAFFPWHVLSKSKSYAEKISAVSMLLDVADAESSTDFVDIIFAGVKVGCDHAHVEDAMLLLKGCLAKNENPDYMGNYDSEKVLACISRIEFTLSDICYLAMLYFYVRDRGTYPEMAFLKYPFELVRRLDFYYEIYWVKQASSHEDLAYVQSLVQALALEEQKSPVAEWVLANLLRLGKILEISTDQILPPDDSLESASISSRIYLIHNQLETATMDRDDLFFFAQSHHAVLLCIVSILSQTKEPSQEGDKLIRSIVFAFWTNLLGVIHSAEELVQIIARILELPELFGVSKVEAPDASLFLELRSDPLFWLTLILTMMLLCPPDVSPSALPLSQIVAVMFESALTNVSDRMATLFLLSCFHEACIPEHQRSVYKRLLAAASSAKIKPRSNLQERLCASGWQDFDSPIGEFLAANVTQIDDDKCLLVDLFRGRNMTASLSESLLCDSAYAVLRLNLESGRLVQLMYNRPNDCIFWTLVLRAFVGDRPAVDGLAALCLKTVQNRAIFARFGRFFEKYLDDTA